MRYIKVSLEPEPGRTLLELLARQSRLLLSVCGGRGRCGKCRVRVLAGNVSPQAELEEVLLSADELQDGLRLACRTIPDGAIEIGIPDWLIMNSKSWAGPRPRGRDPIRRGSGSCPRSSADVGLAVDIGTTNVVVEAFDRPSKRLIRRDSLLNPQMSFGLDVVSRISHGEALIRDNALIRSLARLIRSWGLRVRDIRRTAVVGNTAMCHFFLGRDAKSLGTYPYLSELPLKRALNQRVIGLGRKPVIVLPMIGAYLGADTVAGLVASRQHRSRKLSLLIDLGTNGEIVLGNRNRLLACSTAAGPALEGANLSCGVLARPGAVVDVAFHVGQLDFTVRRRHRPIGFCGSALIKLLSLLRGHGRIDASGRIKDAGPILLVPAEASGTGREITLTQADVRELQLAKAAIAAGIRILLREWGAKSRDIRRINLTGLLGGRLDLGSARSIGLLPDTRTAKLNQLPNLALDGARLALLDPQKLPEYESVARQTQEIVLSNHPDFSDVFVQSMSLEPWA